jgi:trk system potassium uptake protein TrkH
MKRFDYFVGIVAVIAFLLLLVELSGHFDRYAYFFRIVNLAVLGIFLIDVVLGFILSSDKLGHLKRNWLDLIVFVPLVQLYHGAENAPATVIVRQVVIAFMVISRTRKANKLVSLLGLKPAQLMITSFAFAIGVGAILLMLPAATRTGEKTGIVDALFTATSATCVTGLIVKDTATYFSTFGQCVILALIQIGGLGIMTFSVSLAVIARRRLGMERQIIMQEVLDQDTSASIRSLIAFIVKMTFAFEIAGAVCLYFLWRGRFGDGVSTGYHALFHSISAFCNAGFSTFSDSLAGFIGDIPTNAAVCCLIVFGGLGFTVVRDVLAYVRKRLFSRTERVPNLRIQTRLVIAVSALLIVCGAVAFSVLEWNSSLSSLPLKDKILGAVFQSITARTAGFNTVDMSALSSAGLMLVMVLMFIGASPGSTGGGIKTTTFAVLAATVGSGLKRRANVELYWRTIPAEVVQKALSVLVVSIAIVLTFGALLLYFEREQRFGGILFETVSAFGTVGLSTGVTGSLSVPGKVVTTVLMYAGRLGPLTLAYAFLRFRKPARHRFAEERVMIG